MDDLYSPVQPKRFRNSRAVCLNSVFHCPLVETRQNAAARNESDPARALIVPLSLNPHSMMGRPGASHLIGLVVTFPECQPVSEAGFSTPAVPPRAGLSSSGFVGTEQVQGSSVCDGSKHHPCQLPAGFDRRLLSLHPDCLEKP